MIIIRVMGGLGNQLQQYALYQKFKSLGKEVRLDTSWFDDSSQKGMAAPRKLELNYFRKADYLKADKKSIKKATGSRLLRKLHISKDRKFYETSMYHPEIFELEDGYLEGYWASNKYYADILPVIKEKLAFEEINDENNKIASVIDGNNTSNVHTCSVHIRRGDYLDPENTKMFGGIATEAYYDAAISLIRQSHPETEFFVFSDDYEYAVSRHGNDEKFHFIDVNHGENSRYDIYLMSRCSSHICANSTFSFWGARLSEGVSGICIRPTIHKNSQVFDLNEMNDLWSGWLFIDPKGEVKK